LEKAATIVGVVVAVIDAVAGSHGGVAAVEAVVGQAVKTGAKDAIEGAAGASAEGAASSVARQAPQDLKLAAGKNQTLDPTKLSTNRQTLDAGRLQTQSDLQAAGTPRTVGVDQSGQVIEGNHAVRAAADAGRTINGNVVTLPGAQPGSSLVTDLPVIGQP
jgi:hypothetical protein